MKKAIKYVLISAVALILEGVLIGLGKVGFGFAAAVAVCCSLTLNLIKKPIPSAVFTALSLALGVIILQKNHIGVYAIVLGSAALSFALTALTTKYDYGLLLSDALGVLSGYVPAYLLIKYAGRHFISSQDKYLATLEYAHYPLMIGCIAGGVLAFFAVPAVRVLQRYAAESADEN